MLRMGKVANVRKASFRTSACTATICGIGCSRSASTGTQVAASCKTPRSETDRHPAANYALPWCDETVRGLEACACVFPLERAKAIVVPVGVAEKLRKLVGHEIHEGNSLICPWHAAYVLFPMGNVSAY